MKKDLSDPMAFYTQPRRRFFVAVIKGQVAGTVALSDADVPGSTAAVASASDGVALDSFDFSLELRRLAVAPHHRRCGLGAFLVQLAVNEAFAMGAHHLKLTCLESSRYIDLYQGKLGK